MAALCYINLLLYVCFEYKIVTYIRLICAYYLLRNSKLRCCSGPYRPADSPSYCFQYIYTYIICIPLLLYANPRRVSQRNSPSRMARAIRRPGLATYLHKTNYLLIKAITLISNADLQPGLQTRLAGDRVEALAALLTCARLITYYYK